VVRNEKGKKAGRKTKTRKSNGENLGETGKGRIFTLSGEGGCPGSGEKSKKNGGRDVLLSPPRAEGKKIRQTNNTYGEKKQNRELV